ncbi:uncharacterized protein PRCAT00004137001 [Priceomyces carsonii]|uniref:uncharacterized protein n=1 Tax=Priceomyces carsonii TaxID=28549 RepID=UPI002EDB2269|nr:unnamed protein product [Priceomyces carsonii]
MVYSIYSCGSNGNYQLGLDDDEDHDILQTANFVTNNGVSKQAPDEPVLIACGGNHTVILFKNGHLYSCGDNSQGQCGHPSKQAHINKFTKISGEGWTHVSCGWEFTVMVNNSREVFVSGLGLKGELGLGEFTRKAEITKIDFSFPEEILELKSSVHHTIVRLRNNDLYGWGSCRKGQLGSQLDSRGDLGHRAKSIMWSPQPLHFDFSSYNEFALGRESTAFLNLQELRIYGKNPKTIEISDCFSLRAMWSSYHILKRSQSMIHIDSFGNNSHGQKYPGHASDKITQFETGSEHGLILTEDNKVLVWGWGEHGNCGKQIEDRIVFDHLNVIYSGPSPIKFITGGCATTWIVIEL